MCQIINSFVAKLYLKDTFDILFFFVERNWQQHTKLKKHAFKFDSVPRWSNCLLSPLIQSYEIYGRWFAEVNGWSLCPPKNSTFFK